MENGKTNDKETGKENGMYTVNRCVNDDGIHIGKIDVKQNGVGTVKRNVIGNGKENGTKMTSGKDAGNWNENENGKGRMRPKNNGKTARKEGRN